MVVQVVAQITCRREFLVVGTLHQPASTVQYQKKVDLYVSMYVMCACVCVCVCVYVRERERERRSYTAHAFPSTWCIVVPGLIYLYLVWVLLVYRLSS